MRTLRIITPIKLFFLLVLVFCYIFCEKGVSVLLLWMCCLMFYIISVASFSQRVQLVKGIRTFFRIDLLFYTFCFIIYLLPYQLYVLGVYDFELASPGIVKAYIEYTNISVITSMIGLISFSLGFDLFFKKEQELTGYKIDKLYMGYVAIFILLFLLLSLALFYFTGFSLLTLAEKYAGSSTGDPTFDSIYDLVTFWCLMGIGVCINHAMHFKLQVKHKLMLVIVILWASFVLVLGDRNVFFLLAIAALGGWFSFKRRLPFGYTIVFGLVALITYKTIELTRSGNFNGVSSLITELGSSESSSSTFSTGSFDITTTTSRATHSIISEPKDYAMGRYKLFALASGIPYSSTLFRKESEVPSTSLALSNDILGTLSTWKTGTNIISDSYFDFGILGVIIILFFLGVYGANITNQVTRLGANPLVLTRYLFTLALFAELPRYGLGFALRQLIWLEVVYFFLRVSFDAYRTTLGFNLGKK
ncbi:MAG: O-antigen polysaccharide polymerase Wzy [Bacteroidota bacterium]|nr:O-antigen polysaccharide polymerase Wzy [Bacteroidota bacterium]